jgi:hypothetical protein
MRTDISPNLLLQCARDAERAKNPEMGDAVVSSLW